MRRKLSGLLVLLFVWFVGSTYAVSVLFDNSHAETAGNADWTIYGGFSDFGDMLKSWGCKVDSYEKGRITYDVLKNYDAYVIPEPNTRFSPQEHQAILKYIRNGGSVFFIADHDGADRNNDGWDAVDIFNEFVPTIGFKFDRKWFSEAPVSGKYVEGFVTEGVQRVGIWGGTSMTIIDPEHVKGWIFTKKTGRPYVITGTFGKGKFAAIGDSSPFDDGTGAPGNRLHDGWNAKGYQHAKLAANIMKWLLENVNVAPDAGDDINIVLDPNPNAGGHHSGSSSNNNNNNNSGSNNHNDNHHNNSQPQLIKPVLFPKLPSPQSITTMQKVKALILFLSMDKTIAHCFSHNMFKEAVKWKADLRKYAGFLSKSKMKYFARNWKRYGGSPEGWASIKGGYNATHHNNFHGKN